MRKEEVAEDLSALAFDFFYWFSRFEFALKESKYLKSHKIGTNAEPGWPEFTEKWKSQYALSVDAKCLLASPPERQIVINGSALDWKPVDLGQVKSDLEAVVLLVKTVRNNLFHGGKHGGKGWDDPGRTKILLSAAKAILDQLAKLAGFEDHYTQSY